MCADLQMLSTVTFFSELSDLVIDYQLGPLKFTGFSKELPTKWLVHN